MPVPQLTAYATDGRYALNTLPAGSEDPTIFWDLPRKEKLYPVGVGPPTL